MSREIEILDDIAEQLTSRVDYLDRNTGGRASHEFRTHRKRVPFTHDRAGQVRRKSHTIISLAPVKFTERT